VADVELALSGMAQGLAAYISDDLQESGPFMSEELPGSEIIVPGGMAQLAASLASDLPPTTIRLGELVTAINWDEAGVTVVATTANGPKSYRAAHAVVTLPLGVLASSPHIISPPLDAAKRDAVANMRSGRMTKVFVEWTRPWWAEGGGTIYLAWSRAEIEEGAGRMDGWLRHITGFSEVEGQPNLLLMWIAGAAASLVDRLPDAEIVDAVGPLLRQFTGDPGLEFPSRLVTV
jgi:monoamine oxidase